MELSSVGAKGQAYLASHGVATGGHGHAAPAAKQLNLKPAESWVDLHREYADILDTASLAYTATLPPRVLVHLFSLQQVPQGVPGVRQP